MEEIKQVATQEQKQKEDYLLSLYRIQPNLQKSCVADSKGYNYKYCSLQDLIRRVRPILNPEGIFFIQRMTIEDKDDYQNSLTTDLYGKQKGYKAIPILKVRIWLPHTKLEETEKKEQLEKNGGYTQKITYGNSAQALGSEITYVRRYSLYVALGILPEEDKDGKY